MLSVLPKLIHIIYIMRLIVNLIGIIEIKPNKIVGTYTYR